MLAVACSLACQAMQDDLVTLVMVAKQRNGCGEAKLDFVRAQPDGLPDAGLFRVPERQILVITDVEWLYGGGGPGLTKSLILKVENLEDATQRTAVLRSTIRLNGDGAGGASEHLTTGLQVSPSARICPELEGEPVASPRRLISLILRGFLGPQIH